MSNLAKLSAIIYSVGSDGINLRDLAMAMNISEAACRQLVEKLMTKFENDPNLGIEITVTDGAYRLATKTQLATEINNIISNNRPHELSTAAIEVAAIVAYNQPISRIEIDQIRGVNSSGSIKHLLDLNILVITGIKEEVGHPKLYSLSNFGLSYFNISSLDDLPKLPDTIDQNISLN